MFNVYIYTYILHTFNILRHSTRVYVKQVHFSEFVSFRSWAVGRILNRRSFVKLFCQDFNFSHI
jgi:hypothetical protein